jgi:hypothetical protein
MLFFVGDILQGRWWLNHACETEGGLHIYHKVELGPEYWREDGSPKYINITGTALERGNFNSEVFENQIVQEIEDYRYEKYPRIRVMATRILDRPNARVLGEVKVFFYDGGRLAYALGEFAGETCPDFLGLYTRLYTDIFVRE